MDILCFLVLLLSRENQGNNVARSYIKTKYKALTYGTTEILWIRFLLSELWLPSVSTITLWCDNLDTTYLSINFFFMPTLNMSRLQLIRRFKFTSFLPRISLVMFLLNLYLLRSLLVFYPSFMWELYFQLEMAYYKKYTARSYDTIQEIIFISYNLYLKSCVGCHIVNTVHNPIYRNRNYD